MEFVFRIPCKTQWYELFTKIFYKRFLKLSVLIMLSSSDEKLWANSVVNEISFRQVEKSLKFECPQDA